MITAFYFPKTFWPTKYLYWPKVNTNGMRVTTPFGWWPDAGWWLPRWWRTGIRETQKIWEKPNE